MLVSTTDDYFVDVPFAVFSLFALSAAVRSPHARNALLAAIFTGGAIGTKYTGMFVAVATGVVLVWPALLNRPSWDQLLRRFTGFTVLALLIGLPCYIRNAIVFGAPHHPTASVARKPVARVELAGRYHRRVSSSHSA